MSVYLHDSPFPPVHEDRDELHDKVSLASRLSILRLYFFVSVYIPSINFSVFGSHMSVYSHDSPFPPVHEDCDEHHSKVRLPSRPSIHCPYVYVSVCFSSVNSFVVFSTMAVYSHDSSFPPSYEVRDELHGRKIRLSSRLSIHCP